MPRVFVTGTGIISATGFEVESVRNSLENYRTGIGKLTLIDSIYKDEIPVGEIKASNEQLFEIARPEKKGFYTRTALLGLIAARQAVLQSGISKESLINAGIISGTTVGGMDRTERFFKDYINNNSKQTTLPGASHSGRLFKDSGRLIREISGHDCGDSAERIADCMGIKGFISTINTACSSSANAIMLAARLIKQGRLERALAGGTDSLAQFTLNGFNSLMILDRQQCRPFDENRNGLNLGEGAAFLMLESEEIVKRENKTVLAEIRGYGNACDAFHQTASSPEGTGALLAMQKALQTAGLEPADIDYINTHGTGTKNNDLSEGIAIEKLFGENVPPCSSTKSFTGHTLGAAGAIEAVISILALQHQCIFPNLNFAEKMNELKFAPVRQFITNTRLRNIMSNSFGFGGNNSSLIISRN